MIEALLVLLTLMLFGWLLVAALGAMFSVIGWLLCGLFSALGGLLALVLALPIVLLVGLLVLPLAAPLLLGALIVWWALRRSRRTMA